MKIIALIAAAGKSTRMGQEKLNLTLGKEYEHRTFLDNLIFNYSKSQVSSLVITLPENLKKNQNTNFIAYSHNIYPELEYSGSILTALKLHPDSDAIIINPIDAPFTSFELINLIIKNSQNNPQIIIPEYQGKSGHPVLFSKHFYKELEKAAHTNGPREVIKKNSKHITKLNYNDSTVKANINRLSDLNLYQK